MLYSSFYPKQTIRYSHCSGRQPDMPVWLVCIQTGEGMMWQQPWRQNEDTNLFCSMKNPRKSPVSPVGTLARALDSVQQNIADLPFVTDASKNLSTSPEPHSPEEESFRAFLHSRLSRHKAPPALRERIKNAIKQMPD